MEQHRFVVKLLAAFAVFSMLTVISASAAISDLNIGNKIIYQNLFKPGAGFFSEHANGDSH